MRRRVMAAALLFRYLTICGTCLVLLTFHVPYSKAASIKSSKHPAPCTDSDPHCMLWAKMHECRKNPDWMLVNCPCSCAYVLGVPMTGFPDIIQWLSYDGWLVRSACIRGHNRNPKKVDTLKHCISLCANETSFDCRSVDYRPFDHICALSPEDSTTKPLEYFEPCYLDYGIFVTWYAERRDGPCVNERADCRDLSLQGDCHRNPMWMMVNCCRACEDLPRWMHDQFEAQARYEHTDAVDWKKRV